MNIRLRLAILQSTRTQSKLSAVTGIGETRLSRIVNGWTRATDDEQSRIAAAVGADVEGLFADPVQPA